MDNNNKHDDARTKQTTAAGDIRGSAKSAPGSSIASSGTNAIPDDQGVPVEFVRNGSEVSHGCITLSKYDQKGSLLI